MNSIGRLIPYIWPYRQRLILSTLLGVFVALLWGANLSAAFPVVKLLLERESLHEYVAKNVEDAKGDSHALSTKLLDLEKKISEYPREAKTKATQNKLLSDLIRDRKRTEDKLTDATNNQSRLEFIESSIMPWVPRDMFETFTIIFGMLLIATAVKGVFIFMQDYIVFSVVELVVMNIRKKCFRKVMKLDLQTINRGGTADLMSRFTYDTSLLSDGIKLFGGRLVREPLKAIVCFVFALYINWQLTLMGMVFVPVLGLAFYRYGKMIKKASQRMMESMSKLYKILEETFDSLKAVTAFNRSAKHRSVFHHESKSFYKKAMKLNMVDALTKPTTEFLGMCAVFAAMLPGAFLVIRGETHIWGIRMASEPMDPASLALLYTALAGLLDPCRKLSGIYARLKRSNAAIDRIFELIDMKASITDPKEPIHLARHHESIEFKNIRFTYDTDDNTISRGPVLNDISLTVKAGEVMALVGSNGSGKSTLLGLLPRFFDADQGEIFIDGVSNKDLSLENLRKQVGIVTQETILFDESIAENIAYGKAGATSKEIEDAARKAHVLDFIDEFPDGLNTRVGSKGKELSGGQRQRIALARVMLRDPAILILDEATSAIDSQSEYLIHEALIEFSKDRTTFVITHNMSQSMQTFVSEIVVMDAGKIIAQGTHEKLISNCPEYERFYHAPTRKLAG